MREWHQEGSITLQIAKFAMPNGKEVLLLMANERMLCYQRWPNSLWEPVDAKVLRFTKPGGTTAETAI